jgi:uncharacterized membrane protein YsdA (DUF1294 family)/cold shock CspA family protein
MPLKFARQLGINPLRIESMHMKGKITTWNDEKGFGFITPNYSGKQVFIHISAFRNRNRRPEINQLVTYALSTDKQGRPRAKNATLAGDKLRKKEYGNHVALSILISGFFLIIVSIFVLAGKIPVLILALYLVASLLTFFVYEADKSAAQKRAWRTNESTLHLLSLAGGWPGALIAQQKLRHKSQKQSFRFVFWFTVLLNCSAFIWLLTPDGAITLQSFITSVLQGLTKGSS